MVSVTQVGGPSAAVRANLPFIVGLCSLGTLVEWYGFYLYGVLAPFFGSRFFPPGSENLAFLAGIGVFWTGFAARPFGALMFGHLGDFVGRKFALVLTLSLMGAATFLTGLLPGYDTLGVLAPVLLVLLRIVQGLAVGGEYGAAATYVAEHAPDGRRGFYTAWLQTTATLGIVLALLVILGCRAGLGEPVFADWGWRVPFLIAGALVPLALYFRLKLDESPLFVRLKEQGKAAQNPVRDSFSSGKKWRLFLLALFAAAAPEGVIWYTGQFYALSYMNAVLKVPYATVCAVMAVALILGAPFFVVFGALSDRIGRRNVMTLGFLLAAVTFWPVFALLGMFKDSPVVLGLLVFYMMMPVALAYGPLAAFLVELFPARVRCISVSLPYHVGNGVFGGLVPLAAGSAAAMTGTALGGLFYPIAIAALGVVVSIAGLPARSDEVRIWNEVGGGPPRVPDQP